MTISLAGFSYNSPLHGAIKDEPYEQTIAPQRFFGLQGAYVLIGEPTVRNLNLEATYAGYATEALLRAAVADLTEHQGDSGELIVNAISWPNSVFVGFTPSEAPFRDGITGLWVQRGQLRWLQSKVALPEPEPDPP